MFVPHSCTDDCPSECWINFYRVLTALGIPHDFKEGQ